MDDGVFFLAFKTGSVSLAALGQGGVPSPGVLSVLFVVDMVGRMGAIL